jgi:hypothetical protein
MKTVIAVVVGLGVLALGLVGVVLLTVATWPVLAVGLPVLVAFLVASSSSDLRSRGSGAAADEHGYVAGR